MLQPFLTSAVTILVLDTIWLTINKKYHDELFKNVQRSPMQIRFIPAVLVYILIPFAVTYFAILQSKSISESLQKGALIGLSMYGLYDLTNLATLQGWTVEMAIKDTLWGTFACAIASLLGYYFTKIYKFNIWVVEKIYNQLM